MASAAVVAVACSQPDEESAGDTRSGVADSGGAADHDSSGQGPVCVPTLDASGSRDARANDVAHRPQEDARSQPDAREDRFIECPRVPAPGVNPLDGTATVVPLDVLCITGCTGTLAEFEEDLVCGAAEGGPLDGGSLVARYEGCGRVSFWTQAGWVRGRVYDGVTGALVGAAQSDDVGYPLGDYPCVDAAFVAGEWQSVCGAETVDVCRWTSGDRW